VIFGPKEWHSLSAQCLSEFLSLYHFVHHLILIIAPPISQTIVNETMAVLSTYPDCNFTLHHAQNFQNPYEVRNHLATSVQTKYTLHLNNDIFSVEGHSSWLEELIKFAELSPQYCAVMPFLLENNLQEKNRLHVWWKECNLFPSTSTVSAPPHSNCRPVNALRAVFDNQAVRSPFESLRKIWKRLERPPRMLFLEDHCVLVCSAFFRYQPLFDPFSCYRREFFDLVWSIRSRGGDVGMALDSVVVYQRVQPLSVGDLPYFLHRRQDSLCYSSQLYLNEKWNLAYRYDNWHEKQRLESLLGVDIDLGEALGSPADQIITVHPVSVQLLVCFLVAIGANRFRYTSLSGEERWLGERSTDWNLGSPMSDFYPPISSLDWSLLSKGPLSLEFRQLLSPLHFKTDGTLRDRLPSLLGVLDDQTLIDQREREPCFLRNPFSGYCLFQLCWDPVPPADPTNWSHIASQVHVTNCSAIETLPSLIVEYFDPTTGLASSLEAWVWVKTDLEVPVAVETMSSEGRSMEFHLILSTIQTIARHLRLTVRPATDPNGTQLWQSFDLVRQQVKASDDHSMPRPLLTARLLRLAFRPHRLAELERIALSLVREEQLQRPLTPPSIEDEEGEGT
jgi:hypothetical protein